MSRPRIDTNPSISLPSRSPARSLTSYVSQDLTGPTPILRAGRNTYIASIEQLVGTGILLSTAPSFEPVARVESVLVLAALPPLPLGKLAKDKAKKAAATRKRIAAVPRAQKPKAQKLPIEKVGTASKKKTLITSDQEDEDEDSEEQGEGQSGGEASGTGLSRDEVMSDA